MHMFCSCSLTTDKSLRYTALQYNVWPWPPLPHPSSAKGKNVNLCSQQVLWPGGRPPSPSASAALECKLRTLQPITPTQPDTTIQTFHEETCLGPLRGRCNGGGAGVSSDPRQKSNNKFQVGDQNHIVVFHLSDVCSACWQ